MTACSFEESVDDLAELGRGEHRETNRLARGVLEENVELQGRLGWLVHFTLSILDRFFWLALALVRGAPVLPLARLRAVANTHAP